MTMRDRQEKVFARPDDDKAVVAQRALVLGILAMVSSIRCNKRMQFVNRHVNGIRRCAVLKTKPGELVPANFAGHPLKLQVCKEKLKPIAVGGSRNVGKRLRAGVFIHSTVVGHSMFRWALSEPLTQRTGCFDTRIRKQLRMRSGNDKSVCTIVLAE
jgi:hypothetical protein